jgi:hypothetical protein
LAILNQFTQHRLPFSLFSSYLDDVLIIPIVMGISLLIQRLYVLKNNTFTYSIWSVIATWLFFSVAFEMVIPKYSTFYYADRFDVLAYALGGFIFYFIINPAATEK